MEGVSDKPRIRPARWGTWHNHTGAYGFSYCADPELTLESYVEAMGRSPWQVAALTDHAFNLAFPHDVAWGWKWYWDPSIYDQWAGLRAEKTERYLQFLESIADDRFLPGIEVECMRDGRLTFDPQYAGHFKVVLGAVHHLPTLESGEENILAEFELQLEILLEHGVDILAHPTRVLEARSFPVDSPLLDHIVGRCKAAGTAVELNAHKPSAYDAELLRCCLENGVRVAPGTDTHHLDEFVTDSYYTGLLSAVETGEADGLIFDI